MSWMLFIDESGQDRNFSPYEVLAGVAVEDRVLWKLDRKISAAQSRFFGFPLFEVYGEEAKATKLLKTKTFKSAARLPAISPRKRTELVKEFLNDRGENLTQEKLVALSQAKIEYVKYALDLCKEHDVKAFASIVPQNATRPESDMLRKDYVFFFQRFFDFLESRRNSPMGYLVFDETEKVASHILLNQVSRYFLKTENGKKRSRLIIPSPLFVHSDMTTMIQMADLIAYIISWGMPLPDMGNPARSEFVENGLAERVERIRFVHKASGRIHSSGFKIIQNLE